MTPITPDPMENPYRAKLHYDPNLGQDEVWIGYGYKLPSRCGQAEWIAVTGNYEMVGCMKCIALTEADQEKVQASA